MLVPLKPVFRHVQGDVGKAGASVPWDLILAKIPQCQNLTLPHHGCHSWLRRNDHTRVQQQLRHLLGDGRNW